MSPPALGWTLNEMTVHTDGLSYQILIFQSLHGSPGPLCVLSLAYTLHTSCMPVHGVSPYSLNLLWTSSLLASSWIPVTKRIQSSAELLQVHPYPTPHCPHPFESYTSMRFISLCLTWFSFICYYSVSMMALTLKLLFFKWASKNNGLHRNVLHTYIIVLSSYLPPPFPSRPRRPLPQIKRSPSPCVCVYLILDSAHERKYDICLLSLAYFN